MLGLRIFGLETSISIIHAQTKSVLPSSHLLHTCSAHNVPSGPCMLSLLSAIPFQVPLPVRVMTPGIRLRLHESLVKSLRDFLHAIDSILVPLVEN